jgi:hypothetical protein
VPKLNTKPIEAADLSEYLKSDDDFQFELEIFRSCLKGGASSVEHGGTYQNPVTKKDRQFDIRMAVQKEQCLLKLAIECKNLKTNFPLRDPYWALRAARELEQPIAWPVQYLRAGPTGAQPRVPVDLKSFESCFEEQHGVPETEAPR